METIKRIIIHCSATLPSCDTTVADLWQWHVKDNGWSHIGYHYFIKTDGRIFACRPATIQGAGVKGHNENALQICYEGGLRRLPNGRFNFAQDTRTPAQHHSLFLLLRYLLYKYQCVEDICGHRDFPDVYKGCPCFDVRSEYSWLIQYFRDITVCNPLIIPFSYESIKEVNR